MLLSSASFVVRVRPQLSAAFSLGGLFSFGTASASKGGNVTAYTIRTPPATSPREVPTPLVFLSSSAWDGASAQSMRDFASMFAERGYTCLEIDLGRPETIGSSEALIDLVVVLLIGSLAAELRSHIRLTAIPFAPVLIARDGGTLIAQSYVESNPATGLIMISPPASNTSFATSYSSHSTRLPTPLPEFTYEPKFPIAILGSPSEIVSLKRDHRLGKIGSQGGSSRWTRGGVHWLQVHDTMGQEARTQMELWLDEIGV
ncbi:hypothetical protein PUNSTDRAFT_101157 [Punctularia strigosozonata HHB-11173 SS5]|uniref:uncharacterized protein n=1 Tax=Punctularia strigosozonata (strain HHB-11173) TaxID=741275 RepID=UPI000441707B|nr:uncharacterized protein PUNSTDRAFT_101157 [Punctularia strigosozonata HHB-11173 SS5]EIN11124.1 hypothetical protein PUNSTDRAFT_101157 [Punctularia strigosozonata HHB-11173 SS5]